MLKPTISNIKMININIKINQTQLRQEPICKRGVCVMGYLQCFLWCLFLDLASFKGLALALPNLSSSSCAGLQFLTLHSKYSMKLHGGNRGYGPIPLAGNQIQKANLEVAIQILQFPHGCLAIILLAAFCEVFCCECFYGIHNIERVAVYCDEQMLAKPCAKPSIIIASCFSRLGKIRRKLKSEWLPQTFMLASS